MNAGKISIITINYNNKAGLQRTIESVAGQTVKNFEFIVIDGNSNDGSKEVLEKYADEFTYYCSESDLGIYNAMNKGIRIATGQYLLFLNSGDSLYDSLVIETIENQISEDHGIYYGDIIYDEITQQKRVSFPDELTFNFFYEANLSHQASFIKRSLFEDLFYYNEDFKIASDWEFFIYAICKANITYKHLNILVTTYDATGISSNLENHSIMNQERAISLSKYFPAFIKDYTYVPELKYKQAKQFFHIKQYPVAWKILKALMKLILLFLPKLPNRPQQ